MAGLDLSAARGRVRDRIYIDRATITRNPSTSPTGAIDDESGIPLPNPDDDAVVLATGWPCAVRESATLERYDESDEVEKVWEISGGYDEAPELAIGDVITLTTSADTELLGVPMFVRRVFTGTLRVSRKVEATRRMRATDRH